MDCRTIPLAQHDVESSSKGWGQFGPHPFAVGVGKKPAHDVPDSGWTISHGCVSTC